MSMERCFRQPIRKGTLCWLGIVPVTFAMMMSSSGQCQPIIAGWNFPDPGANATVDISTPANTGATITTQGGTSAVGFTFVGATTLSAHATNWNTGANVKCWQIEVNTVGFENIEISSRQRSSGTGPRNFALQYRLGAAGIWTAVPNGAIVVADDFVSGALNSLPLPAACWNQPSLFLRWIMTGNVNVNAGTVATTGTSRIDDIQIVANTTDHFRSIASGIWHDPAIWQTSPTGIDPWSPSSFHPSAYAQTITIRNGHSVAVTANASMDQLTVESGGTLEFVTGVPLIANGVGLDLDVLGTLIDGLSSLGTGSTAWSAGATWRLGNNGTYVKTGSSSAADWQANYEGGIGTIPATATWILRRSGTLVPSSTSVGMIYPNLIIENFHTAAYTAVFAGGTALGNFPTVLGSLDVGGAGTNASTLSYTNTNAVPMAIGGDVSIRSGSTISITGTGFTVEGDILCDGTVAHGAANTRRISLLGGNPQSISGSGSFATQNLTIDKTSNDVTLGMSININGNLNLLGGRILSAGTPHSVILNTNATATNASNSSFVTGRVRKLGNAAFTFPVGKEGLLRPIGMSAVPAPGVISGWTETFSRSAGDCAAACPADGYTTNWGTWTVTATGPNAVKANNWYISYAESSPFSGGMCMPAAGTNPTLHIGPPAGGVCATEDCGAFYDDGPDNITDLRVESPFMDFVGMNANSISFIAVHQGGNPDPNDRVTMWVFNGTEWVFATDLLVGCATSYSATGPTGYVIPLSNALSNISNGRIGFRWQNNGNGIRNTRSFAIDNLSLGRRTLIESHVAEYFNVDGTQVYNAIVNAPLDHVSTCEYWTLDREVGYHPRAVTLSWDVNSCGVTEPADLRVAHFDTLAAPPSWFDRGNTATTGSVISGTVTSGPNSLFGPFTLASISSENPLPITLLSFTGRAMGNDGLLQWTTASEQDNAYFELLASGPDKGVREELLPLGRVAGAGTSWAPLDYRFVDDRPDKHGTYYYQLRQVDFDGTSTLSHVIALEYGTGSFAEPSVWPNPFTTDATVLLDAPAAGTLHVLLRNALGQILGSTSFAVDQGRTSFQLADLAPLAQGVYFLELSIGEYRTVSRLVRQ
jgi:hypothetical protein